MDTQESSACRAVSRLSALVVSTLPLLGLLACRDPQPSTTVGNQTAARCSSGPSSYVSFQESKKSETVGFATSGDDRMVVTLVNDPGKLFVLSEDEGLSLVLPESGAPLTITFDSTPTTWVTLVDSEGCCEIARLTEPYPAIAGSAFCVTTISLDDGRVKIWDPRIKVVPPTGDGPGR